MDLQIGDLKLTGEVPEENVQDYRDVPVELVQKKQPINAASTEFIPRGNRERTITFKVSRVHENAEAAAYFLSEHERQFPVQGTFTKRTTDGEHYLNAALADVVDMTFQGATTVHSYKVLGGVWLGDRPATT